MFIFLKLFSFSQRTPPPLLPSKLGTLKLCDLIVDPRKVEKLRCSFIGTLRNEFYHNLEFCTHTWKIFSNFIVVL